ncbi:glycosyltransferase [Gryllotalpicola protaetiae]|nr:glycosyltransferase [Gryllotalpicola protaetiae]
MVYPHDLGMGGSQLNAIELAARLQTDGHDVVLFGHRGPLVEYAESLGLEFISSPRPHRRPDVGVVAALRREIRARRIDVIHGWEWPPIIEGVLAARGTPAVPFGSVMSMAVAPFIPRDLPLTVGTRQIEAAEREFGRSSVSVLEPPVDTEANAPGVTEAAGFRTGIGARNDELLVVSVSRLARALKLEGLLAAVELFGELGASQAARLVIVGDGEARDQLERAAAAANSRSGREVVTMTGEMADPRAAYSAAEVVLGMGGSALRAVAFGKPLVVQGEHGYWRRLDENSIEDFRWSGWYGIGESGASGPEALRAELLPLLIDERERDRAARFSLANAHAFSLDRAAQELIERYSLAAGTRRPRSSRQAVEAIRCASVFARYQFRDELRKIAHRPAGEDFNAPAKMRAMARPESVVSVS